MAAALAATTMSLASDDHEQKPIIVMQLNSGTLPPPLVVVLATTAAAAGLFSFLFHKIKAAKQRRRPPGPFGLPLVGNMHQLGTLPHRSLKALSDKYGPLMQLQLGQLPVLIVSSASLTQEMLKAQDLAFSGRPPLSMAYKLMYDGDDIAFAPYGEQWRQKRRICTLQLLSVKQVQSFRPVRDHEVQVMLRRIRGIPLVKDDEYVVSNTSVVVNLTEIITALTRNIVSRATFGKTYSGEKGGDDGFRGMLDELVSLLGSFPVGDFIPWLSWVDTLTGLNARAHNNFKQIDAYFDKVIDDHRSSPSSAATSDPPAPRDFVDVLLSLDASDVGSSPLEKKSIKAVILNMLFAGTETSTTTIEWAMAEIIRHPTVLARAQDEVRKVVGTKSIIEDKDLEEMHYLKATIKESMRLHPSGPLVPRQSVKDAVLDGYHIPAKTRVYINIWAITRDPEIWEFPDEFRPERFLHSSVDFKGQHFQYIPFGAGRRGCPGIAFAMPIVELALANLLCHFDWALPNGMNPEELQMDEESGITVHMKSNLVLLATARCT